VIKSYKVENFNPPCIQGNYELVFNYSNYIHPELSVTQLQYPALCLVRLTACKWHHIPNHPNLLSHRFPGDPGNS